MHPYPVLYCFVAMYLAVALARLYRSHICVMCGGRGAHRKGCPNDK